MDFVKSLFIYMGVTFAVTMQGAPAPSETPTPAPQAIVTPAPGETAQPGESPAPGTTVVAPELTPNKSYRLLKQGSRGELVRKLQARLIELGYLGGTVDGAYGHNTRRAVMRFQKEHGLTQDGEAGSQTQTILYESPNVKPNPNVTATLAPTTEALPTPSEGPDASPAAVGAETPAPSEDDLSLIKGAKVVINDTGEPMGVIRKMDGVNQRTEPRLYRDGEGGIHISLYDLGQNGAGFSLTEGEQTFTLKFGQTEVNLYWDEVDGWSADVGEDILTLSVGDVLRQGDDVIISTSFLEKSLQAAVTWDEEELTLIIRIRSAGADDITS